MKLLADVQDVDVNYYVLVPFTTAAAAEWAAGEVGVQFDCIVIGAAAVYQLAPVLASVDAPLPAGCLPVTQEEEK